MCGNPRRWDRQGTSTGSPTTAQPLEPSRGARSSRKRWLLVVEPPTNASRFGTPKPGSVPTASTLLRRQDAQELNRLALRGSGLNLHGMSFRRAGVRAGVEQASEGDLECPWLQPESSELMGVPFLGKDHRLHRAY